MCLCVCVCWRLPRKSLCLWAKIGLVPARPVEVNWRATWEHTQSFTLKECDEESVLVCCCCFFIVCYKSGFGAGPTFRLQFEGRKREQRARFDFKDRTCSGHRPVLVNWRATWEHTQSFTLKECNEESVLVGCCFFVVSVKSGFGAGPTFRLYEGRKRKQRARFDFIPGSSTIWWGFVQDFDESLMMSRVVGQTTQTIVSSYFLDSFIYFREEESIYSIPRE
jgi:hypothetical protein